MGILTKLFVTTTRLYNGQVHQLWKSQKKIVRLYSAKSVLLQNVRKRVDPFGKLVIELPYSVIIKPTDPHEYPNMDTLIVKLISTGLNSQQNDDIHNKNISNNKFIDVDVSTICKINMVEHDYNLSDVTCLIEAPVSYEIDTKTTGDGEVNITGMISNYINVQTEFGNINGSKLQGKKITLSSSEGGSVTLEKGVQGNIEINTAKNGAVKTEKCLGNKLDISTENGDINLGSNYCEKAIFTSVNGNLYLNNLHMDTTIDVNGNGSLDITCLDGSLDAKLHGSTKIQIVRITKDSELYSTGHIHLIIPEDNNAKLILNAPVLNIDKKLCGRYLNNNTQFIGDNSGHTFNVTSQSIQITTSNWMETLDLNRRLQNHKK